MKEFNNTYELIIYLVNENLLSGFYLSQGQMHYELQLQTKITDDKLLNHIKTILNSWMIENATNEGFYDFIIGDNRELSLDVNIQDDLLGFYGNPFDLQKIFSNLLEVLNINSFDTEEWFENFFELTIEFNRVNDKCDFEEFNVELIDDEYISKIEFDYLKNNSLIEIKKSLEQYFIDNMEIGYSDFSVSILENNFNNITGKDRAFYPIKDYLINDKITFII
jgi:hypothetical protein